MRNDQPEIKQLELHPNGTQFTGKTVRFIRFMSQEEADDFGFYNRPPVIEFTDGSCIIAQSDDEGNDGGSLFCHIEPSGKQNVIYSARNF